jgi:hypothetical protein
LRIKAVEAVTMATPRAYRRLPVRILPRLLLLFRAQALPEKATVVNTQIMPVV